MIKRFLLLAVSSVLACFYATASPVLFFDKKRGEELRVAAKTTHEEVWTAIREQAKKLCRLAPPEYTADKGEQLWQRGVGDNMALLAFVGYIANDADFFRAAAKWARASASYPTWGLPDGVNGAEYGLPYGHQLLGLAMLYDYGQDYLTREELAMIRATLVSRAAMQYTAYITHEKAYLQNHTWINVTGMLAAALALEEEYAPANEWIAMTQEVLGVVSRVLPPDGVSQEGVGYWGYGVRWLLLANLLSKQHAGNDFFANDWWRNTSRYATGLLLPFKAWKRSSMNVDLADCPRDLWWGANLMYALANINRDGTCQWYARELRKYAPASWEEMIWFDPTVEPVSPENKPAFTHFDNMDIVVARDKAWTEEESMLVVKCGPPLGKHIHAFPRDIPKHRDVGHVHPDANHFVLFANGEYLFKNNGYVKRVTRYHNTLLIDDKGMWGEKRLFFDPTPLEAWRDPAITLARTTPGVDYITGNASRAYPEDSGLKNFERRFIFCKKHDVLLIIDRVETDVPRELTLNFYPEHGYSRLSPTVFTCKTSKNRVRVENLTPDASRMSLSVMGVQERHSDTKHATPLIALQARDSCLQQVTAISWSKPGSRPAVVTREERDGEQLVVIGDTILKL
jgi:hypothetical protein